MERNVAGQRWVVFAFNRTNNQPLTGDAANITANLRIDGGAANAVDDVNPTELEDGFYYFDLTQVETNGDNIVIAPASSTADIQVIGCPPALYTRPQNFPDLNIATDGDLDGNLNGNVLGSVGSVSGVPNVNVIQISDDAVAAQNMEAFFDGTGYAGTNNVIPSVTTVTGNVNGSVASVTGLSLIHI